jgi:hypothetical protein
LVGELAKEVQLERHTVIPEDNIEIDPNKRVCKVMAWIHLGQDKADYFYHTSEPPVPKRQKIQ